MATHSKFIQSESEFHLENGKFVEADLGGNIAAKMERSTGDLIASNINETYDSLTQIGWHVNDEGYRWWSDPSNQVFGSEITGGSGNWGIYKQSNIYTTARKYAGKDSLYGVHIYREPNIGSGSTWGGLNLQSPAAAKLSGHKYRFSFDYRGYTGTDHMDIYNNYTIGWGNYGISLPTPWGRSIAPFNTWEWQRYEEEYTVSDEYLNWVAGSNGQVWDPSVEYSGGWYGVTYNGFVYRHVNGSVSRAGETPEDTWNTGDRTIWNGRFPMTPGYFDLYRQIKIGFSYHTQDNRGTHVYIDNIQLTDITTNQRWKFNGSGWEADNLSDAKLHIKAVGTAYMGLDKGDGGDIFAIEGSRSASVNGNEINPVGGRGMSLDVLDANGNVLSQSRFDTYGDDNARTALANALAGVADNQYWILTSFDAIRTNATLDAQMASMGSILHINDENEYSVFKNGAYRSTYAAVGRGQKLIKEDGSAHGDTVYKRKAVIDLKL